MSYSQSASPPSPSLGRFLLVFMAELSETQQHSIETTIHFLARLLHYLYPGLAPVPGPALIETWLADTPSNILADTRRIKKALQSADLSTTFNLKPSTLATYQRATLRILKRYARYRKELSTPFNAVSEAWEQVIKSLEPMTSGRKRITSPSYLRKLAQYATALGIDPEALTAHITQQFRSHLMDESGLVDPLRTYNGAREAWNKLSKAKLVPRVTFYAPPKQKSYILDLDKMPPAFREVYDDYADCARSNDPDKWISPDQVEPLSEVSIETNLKRIRWFLGVLHYQHKIDLNKLHPTDLFMSPHYLDLYADFLLERSEDKLFNWQKGNLSWLCFYAETYLQRRWPDKPIDTQKMRQYLRRTRSARKTPRPDYVPPEVIEQVISHMEVELRRMRSRRRPTSPSTLFTIMRDRFMIMFLFEYGNRTADIRNANLNEEFVRETTHWMANFKTKNKQRIREESTPRIGRALDEYLAICKKMGFKSERILLTRSGKPMLHCNIWAQIKRRFHQAVRIRYSPHDFRRTKASHILNETGDRDLAKLLLADSTDQVIQDSYDVVSRDTAYEYWHQILESYQQGQQSLSPQVERLKTLLSDEKLRQRFRTELRRKQHGA
jgi:integrase